MGSFLAPCEFFYERVETGADPGSAADTPGILEYANISPLIGAVLSVSGAKTQALRDLDEWLSVEDCYDILEVAAIDNHNQRVISESMKEK